MPSLNDTDAIRTPGSFSIRLWMVSAHPSQFMPSILKIVVFMHPSGFPTELTPLSYLQGQVTPQRCAATTRMRAALCITAKFVHDVRFGSKADIRTAKSHVRFIPKSGHLQCTRPCPLWANSGHARSLGERGNGGFRDLLAPLLDEVTAVWNLERRGTPAYLLTQCCHHRWS